MGRKRSTAGPHGVLVIDKPLGLTSMRVVERVRRIVRQKRAGHGGTLDPAASGVLPVCLGEATKIVSHMLGGDKEYVARVQLGITTDSYDMDGTVQCEAPVPEELSSETMDRALHRFRGVIDQRPPAFSAIRKDGERLYDKARRGEDVDVPVRQVTIYELELLSFEDHQVELRVRCSKGTYIRSLAHDLGQDLGCGAALCALRRTAVGELNLDRAVTLEELEEIAQTGDLATALIPPAEALSHLPSTVITAEGITLLRQGRDLGAEHQHHPLAEGLPEGATLRIQDAAGTLIAVGELVKGRIQPRRLLHLGEASS